MTARPRVFSGMQPTNVPHIGNYLGAIRNWVRGQPEYESVFCIVNLHALTEPREASELREKTLELAALYYACGVDESRAEVFVQSDVAAHSELAWILDCFIPMGWMERMTQFKVRSRSSRERASVGLFNYPALMASDILLYDTRYVPVGDDQRQHVELCRDVAERMNRLLGDVFALPEAKVSEAGARIMGLDDPELKMSKTEALRRPNHALGLLDPPDVIRSKLARAKTDNASAVGFPPGPGVRNLLEIHRALHDLGWEAVEEEFAGKSYGALKEAVALSVIEALEPIQARYRELRMDDGAVESRLRASAERVAPIAGRTLERVQAATGLRRGLPAT